MNYNITSLNCSNHACEKEKLDLLYVCTNLEDIVALIILTCLGIFWYYKSYKSFRNITFILLWIVPILFLTYFKYNSCFYLWIPFTLLSLYFYARAVRNIVSKKTPTMVYYLFVFFNRTSFLLLIFGLNGVILYQTDLCETLGLSKAVFARYPMFVIFYGLYFGSLGKDLAEVVYDIMGFKIGLITKEGLPITVIQDNVCAICKDYMSNKDNNTFTIQTDDNFETNYQFDLSCRHVFHQNCIKSWCVVGRRKNCPYCNQEIKITKLFTGIWFKLIFLYRCFLCLFRILVVYGGIAIFVMKLFKRYLNVKNEF